MQPDKIVVLSIKIKIICLRRCDYLASCEATLAE